MSRAARLVRKFHRAMGLPARERRDTALRRTLLSEEASEAADALDTGDLEAVAKELADVVVVAYGGAIELGIDLDRAIRLVMASNMTKLPNGAPVLRADGKVTKGPNYSPPDMSSCVPAVWEYAQFEGE